MLTQLFTSRTRIKLLLKLFLNPSVSCYLRELAKEFDLAPNAVKEELDSLNRAGYLKKLKQGRSIYYRADTGHPFFPEINSIVRKYLGIDRLIEDVLSRIGEVSEVYLLDDYAQGRDSGIIDVLIVGDVRHDKVEKFRRAVEKKINRRLRIIAVSPEEFSRDRDVFLKRPHWKVA